MRALILLTLLAAAGTAGYVALTRPDAPALRSVQPEARSEPGRATPARTACRV